MPTSIDKTNEEVDRIIEENVDTSYEEACNRASELSDITGSCSIQALSPGEVESPYRTNSLDRDICPQSTPLLTTDRDMNKGNNFIGNCCSSNLLCRDFRGCDLNIEVANESIRRINTYTRDNCCSGKRRNYKMV